MYLVHFTCAFTFIFSYEGLSVIMYKEELIRPTCTLHTESPDYLLCLSSLGGLSRRRGLAYLNPVVGWPLNVELFLPTSLVSARMQGRVMACVVVPGTVQVVRHQAYEVQGSGNFCDLITSINGRLSHTWNVFASMYIKLNDMYSLNRELIQRHILENEGKILVYILGNFPTKHTCLNNYANLFFHGTKKRLDPYSRHTLP